MRAQIIGNGAIAAHIPAQFAAVLQALQLQGASADGLRRLRDDEWRRLLPMIDQSRLTLPLAQLGYSGFPGWVQERFQANLSDTAQHWKRVESTYRELAVVLHASRLEYVVLKGFTQAPDYVPRPEFRRQGDLDLYVPKEKIPAVVEALRTIEYCPFLEPDYQFADHVPTLMRFRGWTWNGNRFDPEMPLAVEVHFCLWNSSVSLIPVPEVEEFWGRRRSRQLGELVFPALHPVDQLGYFGLHILRCVIHGECPAHHVRELATFLDGRAKDDDFWREWMRLHSPRLRSMQAIAFSLAACWFSSRVPDAAREEIELLSPQLRAWIAKCGGTPLEILFRRTRQGRLLQWLLIPEQEARQKVMWKALSPGRVASPAKVARFDEHPTRPARHSRWSGHFKYPGYIAGRIWMNGWAVLRFIADFYALRSAGGRSGRRTAAMSSRAVRTP